MYSVYLRKEVGEVARNERLLSKPSQLQGNQCVLTAMTHGLQLLIRGGIAANLDEAGYIKGTFCVYF